MSFNNSTCVGIITEYNPFHNGHKYHLEQALAKTDSKYSICVMSGNFMQRGTPAIFDKYTRAKCATTVGVDLVFELPTMYSTGSASDFAEGAVSMLHNMNIVDYLCFGAECDDIHAFNEITDILLNEPESYKAELRTNLKSGLSYPAARMKALESYTSNNYRDILASPNNILGIEYILALRKLNSHIKPVIIKRIEANYHDSNLNTEANISSASAIRNHLVKQQALNMYNEPNADISNKCIDEILLSSLPKEVIPIINDYVSQKTPSENQFGTYLSFIHNILLQDNTYSNANDYLDVSNDFMNSFKNLTFPKGYKDICESLKTKNITYTRVQRALLHMILGITNEKRSIATANGYSHYANLLSARKASTGLIKAINDNESIKIITKKADFKPATDAEKILWNLDIAATDLYNQLVFEANGNVLKNELSSSISIVE